MKVKFKKIRGKNRRLTAINDWINANKSLNISFLETEKKEYVKFWVDPWSRISVTKSEFPEPDGIFKEALINGLFEIYNAWKIQLDSLNKEYYLKIWLFEKNLRKSQVVCAIDDKIDFYGNSFEEFEEKVEDDKHFDFENLKDKAANYRWEKALDHLYIESNYVGEKSEYKNEKDYLGNKDWFEDVVLKNYIRKDPFGKDDFFYVLENDVVWMGEKTD